MTSLNAHANELSSVDTLVPIFKASGDPLRLEILRVLRRDTFGVLELSQMFDMRQSGMSHHLKVMHKDRKSTRLNSSHVRISYAVFCLKKKKRERVSVHGWSGAIDID